MNLGNLRASRGATKNAKRVGRGESSGWGKTSGRGSNGQKARSGNGKVRIGFEGGQMPMYRRVPKRGFTNIFRVTYEVVNVSRLACFEAGSVVDLAALQGAGLVRSRLDAGVKILGDGELGCALTVYAQKFSKRAKEIIEAAGGLAIEMPLKGTAAEVSPASLPTVKAADTEESTVSEPEAEPESAEASEPVSEETTETEEQQDGGDVDSVPKA